MGALLGADVLEAGPGDLVFKPRGEWHTFWNAGDVPRRILEIIAPAGFERFFAELVDLGGVAQADPAALGAVCERYELEMDPSGVPGFIERFGLRFPAPPSPAERSLRPRHTPVCGPDGFVEPGGTKLWSSPRPPDRPRVSQRPV
jgi:hypothetical protein